MISEVSYLLMFYFAIVLLVIAAWLAIQIITRTAKIDWTPIEEARLPTDEQLHELFSEPRRAADRWEEQRPPPTALPEVFDDIMDEVAGAQTLYRQEKLWTPAPAAAAVKSKAKRDRVFDGRISVPKKVYEGTSQTISVIIKPTLLRRWQQGEHLIVSEQGGQPVFLAFVPDGAHAFEVELLAAGIEVAGDTKQRKSISGGHMTFYWNCRFGKKGKYEIAIIIRLIARGRVVDLGLPIKHRVKVTKVLWLPRQAAVIISGLVGFLGGLIGIIDGGRKLGWW